MAGLRLGSLFDGSGGFPLAGIINGIEPVWSSEIEPYPLRVTAARFPRVKQLGDVTKINGAEIEPVDIITFGSPCQDLSIAGKQAGIHDGQRSNLFFEAIRIIKEMRHRDELDGRTGVDVRPRFAVWENVPGAFSSNKGEDFRAVLEAFCGIKCGCFPVPRPEKGRWLPAGCVVGDGFSVAWRVYDAQYWRVPQRRKRIYLIADFGTECAGEILFEREGVSGNHEQGSEARQGTAGDAAGGAGVRNIVFKERAGKPGGGKGILTTTDRSFTLATNVDQTVTLDGSVKCLNPWDVQSKHVMTPDGKSESLCAGEKRWGALPPNVCYPINTMVATRGGKDDMRTCFGVGEPGDPQFTLSAAHEHGVCYSIQGNVASRDTAQNGTGLSENIAHTLNTQDRHAVCYPDKAMTLTARHDSSPCVDRGQNVVCYDARGNGDGITAPTITDDHQNRVTDYTAVVSARCMSMSEYTIDGMVSTLKARDYKGGAVDVVIDQKTDRKYVVRRLTPLECCRLQGFPDWWTEGVDGSDSAKYKMWGNGIALPCAVDVLRRIAEAVE